MEKLCACVKEREREEVRCVDEGEIRCVGGAKVEVNVGV